MSEPLFCDCCRWDPTPDKVAADGMEVFWMSGYLSIEASPSGSDRTVATATFTRIPSAEGGLYKLPAAQCHTCMQAEFDVWFPWTHHPTY